MIRKFKSKQPKPPAPPKPKSPSALTLLVPDGGPFLKTEDQRADMTISCKDAKHIPKVKDAGKIKRVGGKEVQVMHNGIIVRKGSYYGDWMARIIRELKGHHEPQEEKVFYEILKRVGSVGTMIELGSFWSYYSLWFNKIVKNPTNICCEPDPNNMKVGQTNARLNKAKMTFIDAAAGEGSDEFIDFPLESNPGEIKKVPILSVDEIVPSKNLKKLDVLHMDVQGQELAAIRGASATIKSGKLRFLIVSTHHFSISGDPMTHPKCIDLIRSLGGHVITAHSIPESFSGDGLVAASFDPRDRDISIDVSLNSSADSLYRPYEADLAVMIKEYEKLRSLVTTGSPT